MPVGRYGHAGCLSNNQFIVFGGSNNTGYCDETVRVAYSCLFVSLFDGAPSETYALHGNSSTALRASDISPTYHCG